MQVSLTIHHIFALYLSRGADEDRHAVTEWLMLTSQKKATMLPWIHQFLLLHLELQSGSLVPRFRSGLLQIEGAVHLSRLAGLCFFFFKISYRPGSIYIKPDALSCQFSENAVSWISWTNPAGILYCWSSNLGFGGDHPACPVRRP